jgi:hypothetical protein
MLIFDIDLYTFNVNKITKHCNTTQFMSCDYIKRKV